MSRARWRWIVVHHNGVPGRTIEDIWRTHRAKGWVGVGYHYVIHEDGLVMRGRPESQAGAHAKGANRVALGICLVGNGNRAPFVLEQMASLTCKVRELMAAYGIPPDHVIGHREVSRIPGAEPTRKLCPGRRLDLDAFRAGLGAA